MHYATESAGSDAMEISMYSATFKGDSAPTVRVTTFSLRAMSVDYRAWIEAHNLGASHCWPVNISHLGQDPSYTMSYNGRVWSKAEPEVEVDITSA